MTTTTMLTTTTTTTTATRRVYTEHQPKFQRFLFFPDTAADGSNSSTTTPYGRQYAHVYHERLSRLAPWIWQRIEKDTTNTNTNKVSRILELVEDVESTVVGTIIVVPTAANDNPDEYFLEDDSGRVALEFLPSTDDCFVTTGVVVGLTGTVGMDGVFRVKRLITAHSVRTVPVPLPPLILSTTNHPRNRQILLLSGLACGSSHSSSLSRSMLLSYLHGVFGHAAEQVSQVIIAGGLIAAHSDPNTHHHNPNEPTSILSTLQGCYELDGFVAQCTEAGIPVTLIPGQEDPTTAAWPQRPLHSSLLPRASSSTRLLTRATNPYLGKIEHVTLLGTDGRNIPGLVPKTNNHKNTVLDALQNIVTFGHVCPSAPDSVPAVPSGDPFVLDTNHDTKVLPDILFAGNAPTFASRLVVIDNDDPKENNDNEDLNQTPPKYCRLIAIPKFEETGQAVLVNIDTLQVHVLQFEPGQEQP